MKKPAPQEPKPKPSVVIPTCNRCGKPLTQCQCKENDLQK